MADDAIERGKRMRAQILGEEHVARSTRTPLNADFQDLLTEFVWGSVWPREALDVRTRCCCTVAMTIALNRPDELRLHLRAALRNGVTEDELREILIHSAVYCGVPAAHGAFKIAAEVFDED